MISSGTATVTPMQEGLANSSSLALPNTPGVQKVNTVARDVFNDWIYNATRFYTHALEHSKCDWLNAQRVALRESFIAVLNQSMSSAEKLCDKTAKKLQALVMSYMSTLAKATNVKQVTCKGQQEELLCTEIFPAPDEYFRGETLDQEGSLIKHAHDSVKTHLQSMLSAASSDVLGSVQQLEKDFAVCLIQENAENIFHNLCLGNPENILRVNVSKNYSSDGSSLDNVRSAIAHITDSSDSELKMSVVKIQGFSIAIFQPSQLPFVGNMFKYGGAPTQDHVYKALTVFSMPEKQLGEVFSAEKASILVADDSSTSMSGGKIQEHFATLTSNEFGSFHVLFQAAQNLICGVAHELVQKDMSSSSSGQSISSSKPRLPDITTAIVIIKEKFSSMGLPSLGAFVEQIIDSAIDDAVKKKESVHILNALEKVFCEIHLMVTLFDIFKADDFNDIEKVIFDDIWSSLVDDGLSVCVSDGVSQPSISSSSSSAPVEREREPIHPSFSMMSASGMHGFSAILSALFRSKPSLDVYRLRPLYHENDLQASRFIGLGKKIPVFDPQKPQQTGDVLLHDLHQSFSTYGDEYVCPNILQHIVDRLSVDNAQTIVIDITHGGVSDQDIVSIVKDERVRKAIDSGKLNIVLMRSAQKFDMVGIDDYNGGIISVFNNNKNPVGDPKPLSHGCWESFNEELKTHQLTSGVSYQGLCLLQKYAMPQICEHQAIIERNIKNVYAELNKLGYVQAEVPIGGKTGRKGNFYLVENKDPNVKFLHIFLRKKNKLQEFNETIKTFLKEHKDLVITKRGSFGFATSNIMAIPMSDNNEGVHIRWTCGLEDPEVVVSLFKKLDEALNH